MKKSVSSISAMKDALPDVQAAIRSDIARRIAAGETIGRVEDNKIISTHAATQDLADRRAKLRKPYARKGKGQGPSEAKSTA